MDDKSNAMLFDTDYQGKSPLFRFDMNDTQLLYTRSISKSLTFSFSEQIYNESLQKTTSINLDSEGDDDDTNTPLAMIGKPKRYELPNINDQITSMDDESSSESEDIESDLGLQHTTPIIRPLSMNENDLSDYGGFSSLEGERLAEEILSRQLTSTVYDKRTGYIERKRLRNETKHLICGCNTNDEKLFCLIQ